MVCLILCFTQWAPPIRNFRNSVKILKSAVRSPKPFCSVGVSYKNVNSSSSSDCILIHQRYVAARCDLFCWMCQKSSDFTINNGLHLRKGGKKGT